MKIFRHLGLMIAVFWCAAMVIVPLAAAADAGITNQGMDLPPEPPGMKPGQADGSNNQVQQNPGGHGSGGTTNRQGNARPEQFPLPWNGKNPFSEHFP